MALDREHRVDPTVDNQATGRHKQREVVFAIESQQGDTNNKRTQHIILVHVNTRKHTGKRVGVFDIHFLLHFLCSMSRETESGGVWREE
jgi:hypothetical protein